MAKASNFTPVRSAPECNIALTGNTSHRVTTVTRTVRCGEVSVRPTGPVPLHQGGVPDRAVVRARRRAGLERESGPVDAPLPAVQGDRGAPDWGNGSGRQATLWCMPAAML